MRYRHIKEGIRMGAKDLAAKPKKNYTIGFEFEVELDKDYIPSEYNLGADVDDEIYDNFFRNFEGTSFDQWFNDQNLSIINSGEIQKNFEPRYGYADEVFSEWHTQQPEDIKKSLDVFLEEIKTLQEKNRNNQLVEYITEKNKDYADTLNHFDNIQYMLERRPGDSEENRQKFLKERKNWWIEIIEQIKNSQSPLMQINTYILREFNDIARKLAKNYGGRVTKNGIEDEHHEIYIDEAQEEYDSIRTLIDNPEDIVEYFDTTLEDVEEVFRVDYEQFTIEEENEAYIEYKNNYESQNTYTNSPVDVVAELVSEELGVSVIREESDHTEWCVVEDSSLSFGAEITSPALPYETALVNMHRIFKMIKKNSSWVNTLYNTGLHVNIGTWEDDDWNKVDWLKFAIVANVGDMLKDFDRVGNGYCKDNIDAIVRALEGDNFMEYMANIQATNEVLINLSRESTKGYAINLAKLPRGGHFEIRAFGNTGYENKGEILEKYVRKIMRALEIASDPKAFRKEYLKKLYQLFGDWMISVDAINKDDKIQKAKKVRQYYIDINMFFSGIDSKNILDSLANTLIAMYNYDKRQIERWKNHNDLSEYEGQFARMEHRLSSKANYTSVTDAIIGLGDLNTPMNKVTNMDALRKISNDKDFLKQYPKSMYIVSLINYYGRS